MQKYAGRLHSLSLKKIIIAIQLPYCHYFKAKGLFGSFLLEEDTSDY
jgi:hypothetical protein